MRRSSSRSRSRAQRGDTEARQDEDSGRWGSSSAHQRPALNLAAPGNNNTARPAGRSVQTAPVGGTSPRGPATPHSAPAGGSPLSFPRTRCYRLDLERPFDISKMKSPLSRDYAGPPVRESDLPPVQGPVQYDEFKHRATLLQENSVHSRIRLRHTGTTSPSTMMEELTVSNSDDEPRCETSIAISTARIFRGIVVDHKGVITSMNSRATRSRSSKGEKGNKMGEKSRQAAKIDKAKDLIDESAHGHAGGGGSDEENDPSKIISLFVMGEYEELNDLVRDGSKKLRDCKKLSDEQMFMYNRPRSSGTVDTRSLSALASRSSNVAVPMSPGGASSPQAYSHASYDINCASQSPANHRKRGLPADKRSSSRYGGSSRSSSRGGAPPKLKSNPRDTRPVNASRHHMNSEKSVASQSTAKVQAFSPPCGMARHDPGPHSPDYPSGARCNFFPPADWYPKGLSGFGMNFFNCGNDMSPQPTMNAPSSPRFDGASPRDVTGGGMYGASNAPQEQWNCNPGSPYPPQPAAQYGYGGHGAYQQGQYPSPQHREGRYPSGTAYRGNGNVAREDLSVM